MPVNFPESAQQQQQPQPPKEFYSSDDGAPSSSASAQESTAVDGGVLNGAGVAETPVEELSPIQLAMRNALLRSSAAQAEDVPFVEKIVTEFIGDQDQVATPIAEEMPPAIINTPTVHGGHMLTKLKLAAIITLDLSAAEGFDNPDLAAFTYQHRGDDLVTNMFDPFKRDATLDIYGVVRQSIKGFLAIADQINGQTGIYFGDENKVAAQAQLFADGVKAELQKAFVGFTPTTPIIEDKVFENFVSVNTWTSRDEPDDQLAEVTVYANLIVHSGAILSAEEPHKYIKRAIKTLEQAATETATPVFIAVSLRSVDFMTDARIEDSARLVMDTLHFDAVSRLDIADGVSWVNEKLFPATADVALFRPLLDAEPAPSDEPKAE